MALRFTAPTIARVRIVARKLAERAALRRESGAALKPMKRKEFHPRIRPIIAYDLETTIIKAGCPAPLYLTAFGDGYMLSGPLNSMPELAGVVESEFLVEEFAGTRFVAWNGNKFDGYLIGIALLHLKGYEIMPYLAKGTMLRGFRVQKVGTKLSWEFLDGIAMTGCTMPLKTKRFKNGEVKSKGFLGVFAPEYDWQGGPDFENDETFDAGNPEHVKYAERDSEGLYVALMKVQEILHRTFGIGLQTTIGNAGIKIFQSEMPEGVNVWQPSFRTEMALREHAYRGGYCYLMRKFNGPTWKYDLNQAYAAAMRECDLPAGRTFEVKNYTPGKCGIYRVLAENSAGLIPFYYKPEPTLGAYAATKLTDTWLTSVEIEQLYAEGWSVRIVEGVVWEDSFRMTEFVDKLERLRMSDPQGPSGPLGTVCKSAANNCYGKTVERLDGAEFRVALEKPEGFSRSIPGAEESLPYLWYRIKKPILRPYHQPQIGAFITAYVRMVLRRAALIAPDAFIYGDTDCAAFSRPVDLPLDPKIYGKWKKELDGGEAFFITKKVYFLRDDFEKNKKAKGMHTDKLTWNDFMEWFDGRPPDQWQVQKQSFLRVMTGADMFVDRRKVGQRVETSAAL